MRYKVEPNGNVRIVDDESSNNNYSNNNSSGSSNNDQQNNEDPGCFETGCGCLVYIVGIYIIIEVVKLILEHLF